MSSPIPIKTSNGFLELPSDIRTMACDRAMRLERQMEVIIASGRLKATNIIPLGKEILELSSLCCCIERMALSNSPFSVPSHDDLDDHVISCMNQNRCGCCSVLALMDLDGDVLRSFSDDDDDGILPVETQNAALKIINSEVEKAVAALHALFPADGTPSPILMRRPGSIGSQSPNSHLSHRLSALFGRARRKSAQSIKKAKEKDRAGSLRVSGVWQGIPCYEEL